MRAIAAGPAQLTLDVVSRDWNATSDPANDVTPIHVTPSLSYPRVTDERAPITIGYDQAGSAAFFVTGWLSEMALFMNLQHEDS